MSLNMNIKYHQSTFITTLLLRTITFCSESQSTRFKLSRFVKSIFLIFVHHNQITYSITRFSTSRSLIPVKWISSCCKHLSGAVFKLTIWVLHINKASNFVSGSVSMLRTLIQHVMSRYFNSVTYFVSMLLIFVP